jgi:DNA-binding transcriptional LysR family regulator
MRHAKERNAFFEPKAKPFNRVGCGIELTEAGYVFWRARNLSLRGWKRPNSPLNEFGSLKRGAIIVQASQTIVSYWLPHHLVTFRQDYPPIQIRLSNTARFAQRPKMERRKSDLSKAWGARAFREPVGSLEDAPGVGYERAPVVSGRRPRGPQDPPCRSGAS